MRADWSRALNEAGLAVTFVTWGERKLDGHDNRHRARHRQR